MHTGGQDGTAVSPTGRPTGEGVTGMARTIGRMLAAAALAALGALLLTTPATAGTGRSAHTTAWVGNPVGANPSPGPDGIEWPDD